MREALVYQLNNHSTELETATEEKTAAGLRPLAKGLKTYYSLTYGPRKIRNSSPVHNGYRLVITRPNKYKTIVYSLDPLESHPRLSRSPVLLYFIPFHIVSVSKSLFVNPFLHVGQGIMLPPET